jgi:hypothetical protein
VRSKWIEGGRTLPQGGAQTRNGRLGSVWHASEPSQACPMRCYDASSAPSSQPSGDSRFKFSRLAYAAQRRRIDLQKPAITRSRLSTTSIIWGGNIKHRCARSRTASAHELELEAMRGTRGDPGSKQAVTEEISGSVGLLGNLYARHQNLDRWLSCGTVVYKAQCHFGRLLTGNKDICKAGTRELDRTADWQISKLWSLTN